jgi:predicted nuclease of predicted toxin-antitoxin system
VNFLTDHDVPERVGEVLRQDGHTVARLRDVLPINATDVAVLKFSADQKLLLVTCNRDDFLQIAASTPHHGIIVLIRRQSRLAECAAVLRLVRVAGESGLGGNINFA